MGKKEWKIIEAAFDRAVALDGPAREAMLAAFFDTHPELSQQLVDLLAADREDDEKLQQPIASAAQTMSEQAADPWEGRQIGAWTIQRRIADGGMGAVFIAERSDEQYQQTAAMKIMTAQLLAKDAVVRFRAERQILASLNHPNIAKLVDGGSTEEQLPYLVMEYVDGLPIDRFCDEHKLGIAERLLLFNKVCGAVDFAHRNLIVHRDLKPNNILVDRNGEPKLLDFGIAKLIEGHSGMQTVAMTRQGSALMTPEYASPEQVRGETPTIATDVYALGVLLFRLLTGQSPYANTLQSRRDIEQAIVETDPRRPSTVVTESTGENGVNTGPPEAAGALRSTSSQRLRKKLAGDLDNIVLKALQKQAERRYPTTRHMAEDITRYLRHEPVTARPDSWRYRSGKFVRRHARALSVTTAVFIVGISIIAFYTGRLAEERDRANLSAAQSSEIAAFLQRMFNSASPHTAKGDVITAADLLDQGRLQIESLGDQPRLQAELYRVIGDTYTGLGQLGPSIELLTRSLELKSDFADTSAAEFAELHHDIAESHRQNDQLALAEQHMRDAIRFRATAIGENDPYYGYTLGRLGVILFDQRRAREALEVEQRGYQIMAGSGDEHLPGVLDIMGNMANAHSSIGEFEKAEALLLAAIPQSARINGDHHPNTVIRNTNLGNVYVHAGRYEEALPVLEKSYDRALRTWPGGHTQIGFILGRKARALSGLNRMDEALKAFRDMTENYRTLRGEQSARYASGLRDLGGFYIVLGRYDDAAKALDKALTISLNAGGDLSPATMRIRALLGRLALATNDTEAAIKHLNAALANAGRQRRALVLVTQRDLARTLTAQSKFDDAFSMLNDALLGQMEILPANSRRLIPTLASMAANRRLAGALDHSLEITTRAIEIADSVPQPNWRDAQAYAEHSRTLAALNRQEDAAPFLNKAQRIWSEAFGDSPSVTATLSQRSPIIISRSESPWVLRRVSGLTQAAIA